MKSNKDNTVNLETYKKTKSIDEAERYQRILNWKIDVSIDYIKQGKTSDATDLLKATIEQSRDAIERERAKKKAIEVINGVEERWFKDDADKMRWILQNYLK